MLRTNQLTGTDQSCSSASTTARRHPAHDQPGARGRRHAAPTRKGSTLEAWRYDGSWSRLGVVTDSTYGAAGYAASACAGRPAASTTSGRARTGAPPPLPTPPPACRDRRQRQVSLSWSALPSTAAPDHGLSRLPRHEPEPDDRPHTRPRRRDELPGLGRSRTAPPTTTRCPPLNLPRRECGSRTRRSLRRPLLRPPPTPPPACRRPPATPGLALLERSCLRRRLPDHRLSVYRGTSPDPTAPSPPDLGVVTSFMDSGATNGTTFYYKVSASNRVGEGALSNEAFATPTAPPTAPDAPISLRRPPATARSRSPGARLPPTAAPRSPATRSTAAPAPNPTRRLYARSRRRHELHRHGRHERADLLLQGERGERRRRGRALERALRDAVGSATAPERAHARLGDRRQRAASPSPGARPPRTAAPRSPATGSTAARQRRRDASPTTSASSRATPTRASPTARPTTTR